MGDVQSEHKLESKPPPGVFIRANSRGPELFAVLAEVRAPTVSFFLSWFCLTFCYMRARGFASLDP